MLYRKLKTFIQLETQIKLLLLEAYIYLLLSFLLLRIIPFKDLSKRFEITKKRNQSNSTNTELGIKICKTIRIASKYMPWKSLCYDRAITAKWMLNKREIDNHLILGTRPNDKGYEFHAWVDNDNVQ